MKPPSPAEQLRALGIHPEDARLLLLMPLLQIAWADAQVVHREVIVVRAAAAKLGLTKGRQGAQVKAWLADRPDASTLTEGRKLLARIAGAPSGPGASITREDLVFVLEAAAEVAHAGSGMFGFLRYEARAREALGAITADLDLDRMDFHFEIGWDFTNADTRSLASTMELPSFREHTEEARAEPVAVEPSVPAVPPASPSPVPVKPAPPSAFSLGLEEFLEEDGDTPSDELKDLVRETDLRDELMPHQVEMLAGRLLRGDGLPDYCAVALVRLLAQAQEGLDLPPEAKAALASPAAVNAVHKAGWDMAESIRWGGAFSGSTVLQDRLVLRTTSFRQPPADLPPVFAHEGGYIKLLERLHSPEGLSEHLDVDASRCTHFVHLIFCLLGSGAFTWLPVVVPLGDAPGKIVLAPELLSEAETGASKRRR